MVDHLSNINKNLESFLKGYVRQNPALDDDVSINFISSFQTINPGDEVSFVFQSGDTEFFYIRTIAATYAANLLYEVIADSNTVLFSSTEPPSSIGDYRQVFAKPYIAKNLEVKVTNFGLFSQTIQVQLVGWKRPEDEVFRLEREFGRRS